MVGLRVVAGLLTGALFFGCVHGESEPMPREGIPAADMAALGELTTRLTGTVLPAEVAADVVLREEVVDILSASVAADWPGDEATRFAEGLVSVGLWPRDQNLLDSMLEVSANHVSGFYLPRDRMIYVVDDGAASLFGGAQRSDAGRDFLVTHELIHAHQHASHPDLLEFFMSWHSQDDAASAVAAAVEGHALRAAIEVLVGEEELPTPEVVAKFFGPAPSGTLAEMPAFLRLTHSFPYVRGYPLAYREGAAVLDAAPASTEQVMHEERRSDDFWAMDLADAAGVLPEGCRPVYENTLGELGISVLFDELTTDPNPEIWTGWDGDRYMAVRCQDERALVWVTAWDSETDAYQFAQAYGSVAGKVARRAGYGRAPRAFLKGKQVVVSTPDMKSAISKLDAATRRARVTTLDELRSHFDAS